MAIRAVRLTRGQPMVAGIVRCRERHRRADGPGTGETRYTVDGARLRIPPAPAVLFAGIVDLATQSFVVQKLRILTLGSPSASRLTQTLTLNVALKTGVKGAQLPGEPAAATSMVATLASGITGSQAAWVLSTVT